MTAARPLASKRTETLTPREYDILIRVASDMTLGQVGKELGIDESTVKGTLRRFTQRHGVSTQAAAVALALRRGWID